MLDYCFGWCLQVNDSGSRYAHVLCCTSVTVIAAEVCITLSSIILGNVFCTNQMRSGLFTEQTVHNDVDMLPIICIILCLRNHFFCSREMTTR